ncbi:hypothetical protein BKA56DRAFT_661199 [Ilyonectria sp. MPI-CAGE-AT-0026]|nr:hypothetical protein BKA56DRAFT_661199 [Ilyonectria sp. MPI-CAGE-AT-0026]
MDVNMEVFQPHNSTFNPPQRRASNLPDASDSSIKHAVVRKNSRAASLYICDDSSDSDEFPPASELLLHSSPPDPIDLSQSQIVGNRDATDPPEDENLTGCGVPGRHEESNMEQRCAFGETKRNPIEISDDENSDDDDDEEVGREDKENDDDDDNVDNSLALIVYQDTDKKTTSFIDAVLSKVYPATKEGIRADDSLVPTGHPLCSQLLEDTMAIGHILAEVPGLLVGQLRDEIPTNPRVSHPHSYGSEAPAPANGFFSKVPFKRKRSIDGRAEAVAEEQNQINGTTGCDKPGIIDEHSSASDQSVAGDDHVSPPRSKRPRVNQDSCAAIVLPISEEPQGHRTQLSVEAGQLSSDAQPILPETAPSCASYEGQISTEIGNEMASPHPTPRQKVSSPAAVSSPQTMGTLHLKANDDGIYDVEALLAKSQRGRTSYYLVKWTGYSDDDNSWVKRDDIAVDTVNDFDAAYKRHGGNYTGITLLKKRSRRGKLEYLVSWTGRPHTEDLWIGDSKISMHLIKEWEKNKEATSFRKTNKGRRNDMNPRKSRGRRRYAATWYIDSEAQTGAPTSAGANWQELDDRRVVGAPLSSSGVSDHPLHP